MNRLLRLPPWLVRNEIGRARVAGWEWLVMRLCFAAVLLLSGADLLGELEDAGGVRSAHGIGHLIDLNFLANPVAQKVLAGLYLACLAVYVIGAVPVVSLAGLFLTHSLAGTFYLSQGAMHHGQQIVGIVLLGHLGAAIYAWRQGAGFVRPAGSDYRRWSAFACQQMVAAVYVTTGLTKLVRSDFDWLKEVPNLAVQFEKNLHMDFYNKLELAESGVARSFSSLLAEAPDVGRAIFLVPLLFELLCLLALWNRRSLAVWGLVLIAMHLSIGVIMKLQFFYNELLLLVFFVNVPYWIGAALGARRKDRGKTAGEAAAAGV